MAAEYILGAKANCSDGFCGEVSRTIIDPAARTVTHLVIQPKHSGALARLVPLELVDGAASDIRLHCTIAEFDRLDPAEESDKVEAGQGSGSASGRRIGMGAGNETPLVVKHTVPLGKAEVGRHEPVHALDGEIGQVEGFVVNPADHGVTHVLLREGHIWGRKEIAIPVSAVADMGEGIRLNITKEQVKNLPPRN